jgi:hypothetical protein
MALEPKKINVERTLELLQTQGNKDSCNSWRTLCNKLYSILLSGNALGSNDTMRLCHLLNNMNYEERREHILSNWGPQYASKCEILLKQLESLESKMNREK